MPNLVVISHPDDELIACAGVMSRLDGVTLIQTTTGGPRDPDRLARAGFASAEAYADARWRETTEAIALTGVSDDQVGCLGVDDMAGAFHLVELARRLTPFVRAADVVLTHTYETGHPDHDATAFAVHAASRLLAPENRPRIVEMPFYHDRGDRLWTKQSFLPAPGAGPEKRIFLHEDEIRMKLRMIACHRTQSAALSKFDMGAERFRDAARHDFTNPAHAGPSLYPRYGLDAGRWRELVLEAYDELGLEPSL